MNTATIMLQNTSEMMKEIRLAVERLHSKTHPVKSFNKGRRYTNKKDP
jgi:hypothetical protein